MVKDLGCARWIRWLGSEFFLMVFFFFVEEAEELRGFFSIFSPLALCDCVDGYR